MPKFIWVGEISNKALIKTGRADGIFLFDATQGNIQTTDALIIAAYLGQFIYFDEKNKIENFCKTQYADVSVHVLVVDLLREIEPFFQDNTGLLLDPYFSGTKAAWALKNWGDVASAHKAGKLCAGTIDSFLLAKISGGAVHATDEAFSRALELIAPDDDNALVGAWVRRGHPRTRGEHPCRLTRSCC